MSFISFWSYVDICFQYTKLFKVSWKGNTGILICLDFITIKVIYFIVLLPENF